MREELTSVIADKLGPRLLRVEEQLTQIVGHQEVQANHDQEHAIVKLGGLLVEMNISGNRSYR